MRIGRSEGAMLSTAPGSNLCSQKFQWVSAGLRAIGSTLVSNLAAEDCWMVTSSSVQEFFAKLESLMNLMRWTGDSGDPVLFSPCPAVRSEVCSSRPGPLLPAVGVCRLVRCANLTWCECLAPRPLRIARCKCCTCTDAPPPVRLPPAAVSLHWGCQARKGGWIPAGENPCQTAASMTGSASPSAPGEREYSQEGREEWGHYLYSLLQTVEVADWIEVDEQNILLSERLLAHIALEWPVWIKIFLHGIRQYLIHFLALLCNILETLFHNSFIFIRLGKCQTLGFFLLPGSFDHLMASSVSVKFFIPHLVCQAGLQQWVR